MTENTPELGFTDLQQAAVAYEKEHLPRLLNLRAEAPDHWQEMAAQLREALPASWHEDLNALLGEWGSEAQLQRAFLQTPMPAIEACIARLKAQLGIPMPYEIPDDHVTLDDDFTDGLDEDAEEPLDLEGNATENPLQAAWGLEQSFLNLLEAHCFASAPARAAEQFQQALQTLQQSELSVLRQLLPELLSTEPLETQLQSLSDAELARWGKLCAQQSNPAPAVEALNQCLSSLWFMRQDALC